MHEYEWCSFQYTPEELCYQVLSTFKSKFHHLYVLAKNRSQFQAQVSVSLKSFLFFSRKVLNSFLERPIQRVFGCLWITSIHIYLSDILKSIVAMSSDIGTVDSHTSKNEDKKSFRQISGNSIQFLQQIDDDKCQKVSVRDKSNYKAVFLEAFPLSLIYSETLVITRKPNCLNHSRGFNSKKILLAEKWWKLIASIDISSIVLKVLPRWALFEFQKECNSNIRSVFRPQKPLR